MVLYFLIRFRFQRRMQGGGGRGGLQCPLWEVFELAWLCLSLFHTKNNIMSYNISSSPINQYKKFIPLLDA